VSIIGRLTIGQCIIGASLTKMVYLWMVIVLYINRAQLKKNFIDATHSNINLPLGQAVTKLFITTIRWRNG